MEPPSAKCTRKFTPKISTLPELPWVSQVTMKPRNNFIHNVLLRNNIIIYHKLLQQEAGIWKELLWQGVPIHMHAPSSWRAFFFFKSSWLHLSFTLFPLADSTLSTHNLGCTWGCGSTAHWRPVWRAPPQTVRKSGGWQSHHLLLSP